MIQQKQRLINMSYFRKKLERRTYSQDRYYILIKKQKAGTAKLDELTELDEIVNRLPDIRQQVILENFYEPEDGDEASNEPTSNTESLTAIKPRHNFWDKLKSLIHRAFTLQFTMEDSDADLSLQP